MNTSPGTSPGRPRRRPPSVLDVASEIAERLDRSAIRHERRCTWLGRDNSEMQSPMVPMVPTVRSLGGDLYSGTAGVALFLAELTRVRGTAKVRKLLAGALAHARRVDVAKAGAGGLFTGQAGLGYACVRAGDALGDSDLVRAGIQALHASSAICSATRAFDLMSGHAGLVVAAAALCPQYPELEAIVVAGSRAIRDAATRESSQWTWRAEVVAQGAPGRHVLTGLSHGLSGFAAALMVAYRVTGDESMRDAARGALVSEDAWFMAERSNWPDLRDVKEESLPTEESARAGYVCGETWCHGAPGIMIVRAMAKKVLPNREYAGWHLSDAVRSTLKSLERWAPGSDVTLCHGALGLVECLRSARASLGAKQRVTVDEACDKAVARVIRAHGREEWWPSGLPSRGFSPSLMLGMAGVGYQLLREAGPERVPSLLLPGRF
jgi:lantibiotic biosynthesis protein